MKEVLATTQNEWWTRTIARLVVVGIIIAAVTGGLLHRSDNTKPTTQQTTRGASHEHQ